MPLPSHLFVPSVPFLLLLYPPLLMNTSLTSHCLGTVCPCSAVCLSVSLQTAVQSPLSLKAPRPLLPLSTCQISSALTLASALRPPAPPCIHFQCVTQNLGIMPSRCRGMRRCGDADLLTWLCRRIKHQQGGTPIRLCECSIRHLHRKDFLS